MRKLSAALIAILTSFAVAPVPARAQSLTFDSAATLGFVNTDKITEASGVAVSLTNQGVFWTHNDGTTHHIYAVRLDGTFLASFDFNKTTTDFEDIATGPGPDSSLHYVYMGDIGSNASSRDTVTVFRAPEPAVDPAWADDPQALNLKNVDTIQLKYPDGKYDAETLMVDPIQMALYVVTKQPGEARVYRVALSDLQDGKTRDLQFVQSIPFSVASGGAISADGLTIAIRREDFALGWTRNPAESIETTLAREGTIIPVVGPPTEPNGEGIDFLPDGSGYITLSEGFNQPVYFFKRITNTCADAPQFTSPPQLNGNGQLLLTFTGCPGATVAIEKSTSFTNWQQIGTATISTNSSTATYADAPGAATVFYRLRVVN